MMDKTNALRDQPEKMKAAYEQIVELYPQTKAAAEAAKWLRDFNEGAAQKALAGQRTPKTGGVYRTDATTRSSLVTMCAPAALI